jgi:hypothetical protein
MGFLVPALGGNLVDDALGAIGGALPKIPAIPNPGSLLPKGAGAAAGKIGGVAGALAGDLLFPAPVADGTVPEGAVPITPNTVENAPGGESLTPTEGYNLDETAKYGTYLLRVNTLKYQIIDSSGTEIGVYESPAPFDLGVFTNFAGISFAIEVYWSGGSSPYKWQQAGRFTINHSGGAAKLGFLPIAKKYTYQATPPTASIYDFDYDLIPVGDSPGAPTYSPTYDPALGIPIPAGNNPADTPQDAAPAAPFPNPFPENPEIPNWLDFPGAPTIPTDFPPIDGAPPADIPIPVPVPGIENPEDGEIIIPEIIPPIILDKPAEIVPEIITGGGGSNNGGDNDEEIPIIIPAPIPVPEVPNPPSPGECPEFDFDELFGDCTPQEICEKLDNIINNTISIINNQAITRHVTIDTAIASFHNAAILSNDLTSLDLVNNLVKNSTMLSVYANNGDVVDISNLSFTNNIISNLKPLPDAKQWQTISTIYTSAYNAFSHIGLALNEHRQYLELILANSANIINALKVSKTVDDVSIDFAGTGIQSEALINFYKAPNFQESVEIGDDDANLSQNLPENLPIDPTANFALAPIIKTGIEILLTELAGIIVGDLLEDILDGLDPNNPDIPITETPENSGDKLFLITDNISKINDYAALTVDKIDAFLEKLNKEKSDLQTQFDELEEQLNSVNYPEYLQPEINSIPPENTDP